MKKGFTLIEVMIVIAIIGIIVAVVLPVISKDKYDRDFGRDGREPPARLKDCK